MVCLSTIVYSTLGIIGALLSKQYLGLLFVIPYAILIEWVCSKSGILSWILIFLPPVIMALYVSSMMKQS